MCSRTFLLNIRTRALDGRLSGSVSHYSAPPAPDLTIAKGVPVRHNPWIRVIVRKTTYFGSSPGPGPVQLRTAPSHSGTATGIDIEVKGHAAARETRPSGSLRRLEHRRRRPKQ